MNVMPPLDKRFFESYFGVDKIPSDVLVEYGIQLKLYHGAGRGSGAYGVYGCIQVLRILGYGDLVVDQEPTVFDWKDYFGKRVFCKYGSEDVAGTLVKHGVHGKLIVDLEGAGRTELPPHLVKPVPEERLGKSEWELLKEKARSLGISVKGKKKEELAAEVESVSP